MKLSMNLFADSLAEFEPTTDIKSGEFEIETIRLFSANVTMEENTMYIGRLNDLFVNGSDRIICTHRNNLIQLKTSDLESVLNCVLNTISQYNRWDEAMIQCLTQGGMLQDLFDTSEPFLRHPVFLLDAAQRHLAHTRHFENVPVDEMWDAIVKKGSCDLDFLVNLNKLDPGRSVRKGIFTYEQDYFPNKSYHYNFNQQNRFLGSASYIIAGEPLGIGDLDRFYLFCQYLDRWFQFHIQEQDSIILDLQMLEAISNRDADNAELIRRLQLRGWKETDPLVFYKVDAPFQPFNINAHLVQTLNAVFPNQHSINADLSICMLFNLANKSKKDIESELCYWLKNSNYYGTVGEAFHMNDSFYDYYQFVDVTSRHTGKQVGIIYEGKDYILPYMFHHLSSTVVPSTLHPALHDLMEYDELHHTEFYPTLYTYLKNDRNIARTAEELHLHRNTLLYRLDRLKEMVHDNMDDHMVRLYLMMSFEIMRHR